MKNQTTVATHPAKPKRWSINWSKLGQRIWKHRAYYIMMLPAIIYIAIFKYVPMRGIQMAFQNFRPVLGYDRSPWVGFKHFVDFVTGPNFVMMMENTLTLTFYSLVVGFPIPTILALMLNEVSEKVRKPMQTILYAPHFISTVVLVGMINILFSPSVGIVNQVIEALGGESIYFIVEESAFSHLYVWSGVWQQMGWNAIIYIAALSAVDPQLHEAARIDGATLLQRIRYVNLPTIMPTVIILLVMRIGTLASVGYEKIYLMQNDLNINASEVISTYVYKRGILNTNYSFSAAVDLFNNVVNIMLLLLANQVAKKTSETSLF